MSEIVFLIGVLSVFTLVVGVLYSKRIFEAHRKYVEAKNVVDDIVISFNRQLRRQEEQLAVSTRKIEQVPSHTNFFAGRLDDQKKEMKALSKRVESLSASQKAFIKIDDLENRFTEFASMRDTLLEKFAKLEKELFRPKMSEVKIDSAIPIKREKALAPLTRTELTVLEFLAIQGEKTAPEIKEKIELSREHTARLMKKLYEEGYLERNKKKIPFTYRIKEEMQKILRRPERKVN